MPLQQCSEVPLSVDDSVVFKMRDDGRLLIKVQVSREALAYLERRQIRSDGAVTSFERNRNAIERAASRVYDGGRFERDGSIRVTVTDLLRVSHV